MSFSFFSLFRNGPRTLSSITDGDLVGTDNYTGKDVTPATALTLSAVWACVRIISESIASLPCGVFTKDESDNKLTAKDSNLYGLIHNQPNADMTAFDFWQAIIATILLWGNAYVLKTVRDNGKIIALEPLYSSRMQVKRNEDGSCSYIYTDPKKNKQITYNEDQIVTFKGLSLDGRQGLSVIRYAMNSMGNALALEETSGRLYSNGMRPAGALTLPNILKGDQRKQIRKSIAEQISGVARSGGTIVLEGGMTYQQLSMPPQDAQMLESKSFSVEEICRWFGVPPSLIGHTQKTTTWGTGLEQINLAFLTYTLRPHLTRLEQEIKRSLLTAKDKAMGLYAEFNVEGFLRADSAGRAALYSSASQNGWMSRAEIRQKENLPHIEGSETLTVQSALVPLDQLGMQKDAKKLEDTDKV